MPRYIDADALCEHLQKKLKADYEMGLYNHHALTESFIRFVDNAPAEDVAEVRHGHWKVWENHPTIYGEDTLYVCSECTAKYTDAYAYKYCPHCGAKMDAERSKQ